MGTWLTNSILDKFKNLLQLKIIFENAQIFFEPKNQTPKRMGRRI